MKRGTKLFILVLLAISVGMIGIMYLLSQGHLKSYSIADQTTWRWMLFIILASIALTFLITGYTHRYKEDHLFTIQPNRWHAWNWYPFHKSKIRQKFNYRQALVTTGVLFLGVAALGMGNAWYIQVLHYIFTLCAAVMAYNIAVHGSTGATRYGLKYYLIGAAIVWVLGVLHLGFSIYFGEFLFTIGMAYWFVVQVVKDNVI